MWGNIFEKYIKHSTNPPTDTECLAALVQNYIPVMWICSWHPPCPEKGNCNKHGKHLCQGCSHNATRCPNVLARKPSSSNASCPLEYRKWGKCLVYYSTVIVDGCSAVTSDFLVWSGQGRQVRTEGREVKLCLLNFCPSLLGLPLPQP